MITRTAMVLCFCGSLLVLGQTNSQQKPPAGTTTAGIPGVVAAGTKVELIWMGFQSADGIIGAPDGSLLFAEQVASRVSRIDKDGNVSAYLQDTNGTGALAIDSKGRIISAERLKPGVGILTPSHKVLADNFEGEPLKDANDLVVDKKGGVYFTEGRRNPRNAAVYYINSSGRIIKVTDDVARANGIMLDRDEKTLYVTNGPVILAFDVRPDGSVTNLRPFARTDGGDRAGSDGLAIDSTGRLYVASPTGVQVFSPQGQHLGTIPTPRPTTSVAFAGPGKKTLYVVGRGAEGPGDQQWARSIYKIPMLAEGFKGRAK